MGASGCDGTAATRQQARGRVKRRKTGRTLSGVTLVAVSKTFDAADIRPVIEAGQRVFGAIGFVAAAAALGLWGTGGSEMAFSAAMKLMKWYPLLTLPMFIFMGYVLSESRIADDLYRMFHVWMGPLPGGLAVSVVVVGAFLAASTGIVGATVVTMGLLSLPTMLRRNYSPELATGVIAASGTLSRILAAASAPVASGSTLFRSHGSEGPVVGQLLVSDPDGDTFVLEIVSDAINGSSLHFPRNFL